MTVTDEIKSRIDIVNYISRYVPNLKKAGKDWKAKCPFHDDRTPSFVVSPSKQTWRCYGACNDGGDIFTFAQRQHGWSFKEALTELANESNVEITRHQPSQTKRETPTLAYYPTEPKDSDSDFWQERAKAFINYCEDYMWSDDSTGRDYLYSRGFTRYTIEVNRLGYCPQNMRDDWGICEDGNIKKVWLPRGIVIPYERGELSTITKLRTRRLDWKPGDKIGKVIPPAGIQNTAHLNRDIQPGDVVVMVEGEFDAIILKQAVCNPRIVAMATGGTGGARLLKYIALLSLASKVILAFDADVAGDDVSKYWMDALNNAVRKRPVGGKDINDMYLAGVNLNLWLSEVK